MGRNSPGPANRLESLDRHTHWIMFPDFRWYVYLVRCRDGSLYTGIATDVSRRFAEHQKNTGKAAKFLRGKGPLELVFRKKVGSKGLALRVEDRIRKLPKTKKEQLIANIDLIEGILNKLKKDDT